MTDTNTTMMSSDKSAALDMHTIFAILIAGSTGTIAFDLFGQAISPGLGFANLAPVGLARSLLGSLGLPNGNPAGNLLHLFLVGLIAYPVGWLFIAKPIIAKIIPGLHWVIASAIYGVGLWVFAIGGVTAVAGLPFFLNFTGITWVALTGHTLYAIVCAATFVYLNSLRAK